MLDLLLHAPVMRALPEDAPATVALAEVVEGFRDTRRDFRAIDPRQGRVLLVEAVDRVLTSFPPSLSRKAARSLEQLGVTPLLERTVVEVRGDKLVIRRGPADATGRRPAHLAGPGRRLPRSPP